MNHWIYDQILKSMYSCELWKHLRILFSGEVKRAGEILERTTDAQELVPCSLTYRTSDNISWETKFKWESKQLLCFTFRREQKQPGESRGEEKIGKYNAVRFLEALHGLDLFSSWLCHLWNHHKILLSGGNKKGWRWRRRQGRVFTLV